MLAKDQLQGMWVSVPTEWDEHGNFDERVFRDEIALLIEAGAHGLYTTGSTGEFYALDWEEYKQVTDAFLVETVGKVPVQVGANWFNTRGTIRRARYARDKGAGAVQICFPAWMKMRQQDYDQFLVDVCEAVPDIALIHYNVAHTKKLFHGWDYARVSPRVPTLIGTKAAMTLNDFMELIVNAPEIRHFTGEGVFPLAHLLGAKGMYAAWFMMNPSLFHQYYQMCLAGRYREAIAITYRLTKWHETAVRPLIDKGYLHATLDKAFVEIGGWLPGNRHTRKPHQPLTDQDFAQLKRLTAELMPEFVSYRP
jgi:dihydrodipicolinate synthase/N-acetylneuraminate lyase